MIAYIKGVLEEAGTDYVVVETGNIGYQVKVPARVLEELPGLHSAVKLYTYTYVREDVLALYGFLYREDLAMFQTLLGVSGVGPKGALGLLSVYSARQLGLAVLSQDSKAIAKAPGIGARTAQRILIDLKDKVDAEELITETGKASVRVDRGISDSAAEAARKDALEALTALGYSPSEAYKGISGVTVTEHMSSEDILKAALKGMI